MNTTKQRQRKFNFHLLQGILPWNNSTLSSDIAAGIVLAALGIPEVMGYTKISGTPIATGLYTLLLPAIAFAIFGSSRHLVVAADSATAAIIAAGLFDLAQPGSPHYLALAQSIAIVAAGLLLLARLFGLGFLADFLSRTVLIGFLTGVGIQVAIGQLSELLGLPGGGKGVIQQVIYIGQQLPHTHLLTLGISIAVLAIILLFEKFIPKFPGALLAVIGAILASWLFDFTSLGVTVIGPIPSRLPALGLPEVALTDLSQISGIALSCCIVIIAQSAATSRAYAFKYKERFDENTDLIGLATANLIAGLSGTFVVNGSPTKTAIIDTAGGRSQVSQLTTVGIVLIVVLFLTEPISYLPNAALAAIVFSIGLKLIDIQGMLDVLKTHQEEFYLTAIAAATVIFIGVKEGIIAAVMLSLILHVYHSYRPNSSVLIPGENRFWKLVPPEPGTVSEPGLIIYRFSRDLFYANTAYFSEQVQSLVYGAPSPIKYFILEARAITEIDYSASQTIRDVVQELSTRHVVFIVSGLAPDVRATFDRDGLTDLIGIDFFFNHLEEALALFDQRSI